MTTFARTSNINPRDFDGTALATGHGPHPPHHLIRFPLH